MSMKDVRGADARRYFVKCGVDGFVNHSRPYSQFARALLDAQHLDSTESCGPHTVVAEEWIISDDT